MAMVDDTVTFCLRLVQAGQQFDAQVLLKPADLATHRFAADKQFLAGAGEAQVSGHRLEYRQAVHRWQSGAQVMHALIVTLCAVHYKITGVIYRLRRRPSELC
jgi:hypothetical protein